MSERVHPGWLSAERRVPARMPTVAELLAHQSEPLFSFEFFPPRDAESARGLWRAVRELEALGPDYVSVTYGANGSTRDRTVRATADIAEQTTLRTMAHLTCVSQSRDELRQVIGAYSAVGIHHVLAIRGDPPGGPAEPWVPHPDGLANATELVRLIRSLGDFCVGVAAFPDVHPNGNPDLDADILVAKAEAGASFAITQLFFRAEHYFQLVQRVRDRGCDMPIIPGVMPVTTISQIARFAELSGAELPPEVTARLYAVAEDPASVRAVGIEIGVEMCRELLAGGAPGLQFFTQNRSKATREIFARVR